jgi:4-diphosphocytidyl-2-C-methyl-D-erythritol kinase
MSGVGDRLGPPLTLPPLFAVLANPGAPAPTGEVFARLGLAPGEVRGLGRHPQLRSGAGFEEVIRALEKGRNDLEDPAGVLTPIVTHVLAALAAARGCRLARMSGSGATCYGVFATCRAAATAAKALRRGQPDWWVKATVLR